MTTEGFRFVLAYISLMAIHVSIIGVQVLLRDIRNELRDRS